MTRDAALTAVLIALAVLLVVNLLVRLIIDAWPTNRNRTQHDPTEEDPDEPA